MSPPKAHRARLAALALCGVFALVHAGSCGVPEYDFVPEEPGGEGGEGGSGEPPIDCEPGLGDCDGDPDNGCEASYASDPSNCGRCGVTCASGFCSGSTCSSVECPDGFADCNGEEADRCETDLDSIDSCGACDNACSELNATPDCTSRGCVITCDEGFADCDDDPDTGCEVRLATDADHCGACNDACANEHGSARCVDGECAPRCDAGFGDCDGDPTNGCEADLAESLAHCGACGERCAPANADGACVEGVCQAACRDGYANCNGDHEDGCEADLGSPETCGSCSNRCIDNGGTPHCDGEGNCSIVCDPDRGDCLNGLLDGCETNTQVSVRHCGACDDACPADVGSPACYEGVCGISTCIDPNAECDPEDPVVCETNVTGDVDHCGACGNQCFFPNGTAACVDRACTLTGCADGYADCSAEAGCETVLGTLDDCRSCGEACRNDHGTTACRPTGCVPTCALGWGDCDASRTNGCETNLRTSSDCNACGSGCSLPNATASCATGNCTLVSCNAGFGDCSSAAGCETSLGSTQNCAACGNTCTNPNGSTSCAGAPGSFDCAPSCTTGFGDCDGNPDNGCETSLTTAAHCGMCGRACSGATPNCVGGTCSGSPPGLCAGGGFALCDDFEDNNANGWGTTGGSWSIITDQTRVYAGGGGSYRSTTGSSGWADQTVRARVKVLSFGAASSSYRAGILARYGGSTNYYTLQIDGAGDLRLLRGTSTLSGSGTCGTISNSLVTGSWYTLRLQVSGGAASTRLVSSYSTSGTTFIALHDCTVTSSPLTSGSAGVITVGSGTNAEFDDFAVTTP